MELRQHRHQVGVERRAIDQQRLGRAAHADAAHLGVGHEVARHVEVCVAVDVDMADAVVVAQHRHAALGRHAIDQRASTARHDQVEPIHRLQHFADGGAVGGRHQGHAVLGQAGASERTPQQLDDEARGMEAVGAAAQHDDIARLQAERARVGGHIGTRLVDHADDADRHAHAADHQPVRPLPFLDLGAHRIGQGRDVVEALGHALDARIVQQQSILQGARHAGSLGGRDVLGVGGEDGGLLGADQARALDQRLVLGVGRGIAQRHGGGLRAAAEFGHDRDGV